MASLIHFNLNDPDWVLPDRNTIPHNVPFFQNLRELMPEVCHKRGVLAIGGMTALYPSREDPELNARALEVLAKDKKNEADCLMDGAWTGHQIKIRSRLINFRIPTSCTHGGRTMSAIRICGPCRKMSDSARWRARGLRSAQ